MKRIVISLMLTCTVLGSMAQNELQKCIDNLPSARLVGNSSEQGHDRLDSLYYLNTMIYELPYGSKYDKQYADGVIQGILLAYDKDVSLHTGGYCSASQLRTENPIESRKLQMYYSENMKPFTVGGMGRNYALLRTSSRQNPNYRTVTGIEWWLEVDSKKHQLLKIQSFRLFGPLNEDLYQNALQQADKVEDKIRKQLEGIRTPKNFSYDFLTQSHKSQLLQGIKIFKNILSTKADEKLQRATVSAINERIISYLNLADKTEEDIIELFRVLSDIPGYQAEVFSMESNKSLRGTFGWLAEIYPKLDIFCITWDQSGDPRCTTVGPDGKLQPLNFIYHVHVTNKDLKQLE